MFGSTPCLVNAMFGENDMFVYDKVDIQEDTDQNTDQLVLSLEPGGINVY